MLLIGTQFWLIEKWLHPKKKQQKKKFCDRPVCVGIKDQGQEAAMNVRGPNKVEKVKKESSKTSLAKNWNWFHLGEKKAWLVLWFIPGAHKYFSSNYQTEGNSTVLGIRERAGEETFSEEIQEGQENLRGEQVWKRW